MSNSRREGSSGPPEGASLPSPNSNTQRRAGSSKSRATVRASLACVPCRTKHLKCDGGLPACTRCRLEERSCHYAKSRRGIRDPKKRDIMREEEEQSLSPSTTPQSESHQISTPSPEFHDFGIAVQVTRPLPGGWSIVRDNRRASSSSTTFLLDLYYTYFHDTHSWMLPKLQMVKRLQTHAADMPFVANVIAYVGSVYSTAIDTVPLRERALAMACGPLPPTVWTIQSLMVMAFAFVGEAKDDMARGWLSRAAGVALEIGLHHKEFADAEPDPMVAESYRRTYWGLRIHGCLTKVYCNSPHFTLYGVPATTELPCEEWEYQSGEIPTPISLTEYGQRTASGSSCSSWAYFVELAHICEETAQALLSVAPELLHEAVDEADRQLVAWLMQLPSWKKELVDPDGAVDMILFHSIAIAHWTRIRLQAMVRGVGINFQLSSLPTIGPIFSAHGAPTSDFHSESSWVPGSVAVQASLSLLGLFKFALPPSKLSPIFIKLLGLAAMPLLDACLFGSGNSVMLREQILLLADTIAKSGEYWPVTRPVSEQILAVLGMASTARTHSPWDALIDEIVPQQTGHQDVFLFPPPKTAIELNAWAEQQGQAMDLPGGPPDVSFPPGSSL